MVPLATGFTVTLFDLWRGRPIGAVVGGLVILVILVLAGCGGSSKPAPTTRLTGSRGFGLRLGTAQGLLVQCALSSGALKPQPGQPWNSGTTVLPLSGTGSGSRAAELSSWGDAHSATVIGGRTLSYWQQWAAQYDALPVQVCRTSRSASALQTKIYPGQPNPVNDHEKSSEAITRIPQSVRSVVWPARVEVGDV